MEGHIDIKALVIAAHTAIITHVDELTELDCAIGDGDHGLNMKRGMDAVLAEVDQLAAMQLNDALGAAGKRLVMTIGGASGPLFATFLSVLGRELENVKPADAFAAAVEAVAKRGKSKEGEKTLLDVLFPIAKALNLKQKASELARVAQDAARATIPLQATKGRASYLGSRSIGHMDPGARSVSLIMDSVASVIGQNQ